MWQALNEHTREANTGCIPVGEMDNNLLIKNRASDCDGGVQEAVRRQRAGRARIGLRVSLQE